MARQLADIKNELGTAYISQASVQTAYGLNAGAAAQGFDANFSKVSIESMLFYAFAFAVWSFEMILDLFKTEIQAKVDGAYIANSAWWHAQAMAFQKGIALVMNPTTFVFSYPAIDATKQIIKRVAVRQNIEGSGACKVQLFVATETGGVIAALADADKGLFEAYASVIKPAGVLVDVITGTGDVVDFVITIDYNPLIIDSTGKLIIGANYPVIDAITAFISALNANDFGGNLNITKFMDAIQLVDGVVDVAVTEFKINTVTKQPWGTFKSTNGWFSLGVITPTYQPHIL